VPRLMVNSLFVQLHSNMLSAAKGFVPAVSLTRDNQTRIITIVVVMPPAVVLEQCDSLDLDSRNISKRISVTSTCVTYNRLNL
jgi:hypothetical protein